MQEAVKKGFAQTLTMRYHRGILFILLLISFAFAAFPKPTGYVNDFANILTYPSLLDEQLRDYEKNTTIEIVLVTISSLPEEHTLFTYSSELFQEWGIGKKGEDNGILAVIVANGTPGSRLRIELGYGIQGYITGAEAGRTLDEAMPFYGQGDYQKTAEIIMNDIKKSSGIFESRALIRLLKFLLPSIPRL